jgi:chromosome segregation ATPase
MQQDYFHKAKFARLEQRYKNTVDELNSYKDDRINHERDKKRLLDEIEKLKIRVRKLIAKKGNFSVNIKTCKKCTKEYNEKENFNWSCRTH